MERVIPKDIPKVSRFTSEPVRFIVSIVAIIFSLYIMNDSNLILRDISKYLLIFYSILLGQIILKYFIRMLKYIYYKTMRHRVCHFVRK